jgi:hypothetical protein
MKIQINQIKIDCSMNPRVFNYDFTFMLLVSDDPRELFRYYNKSEFHGLNVRDCEKRLKSGGNYIDGLVNYNPHDVKCDLSQMPFMFLNLKTMNEQPIWKTATLIFHESCHMMIMMENHSNDDRSNDPEIEELIITGAETIANMIMETLQFPEMYFKINLSSIYFKNK